MKKFWTTLLLVALPLFVPADETTTRNKRTGETSCYATRDATTLSMMGWGVGLAAGIAALCALIHNESGNSHSHGH